MARQTCKSVNKATKAALIEGRIQSLARYQCDSGNEGGRRKKGIGRNKYKQNGLIDIDRYHSLVDLHETPPMLGLRYSVSHCRV